MVWVGPPFEASGPSIGSPVIVPVRPRSFSPSPIKLLMPDISRPGASEAMSPPCTLLATIVLFMVRTVGSSRNNPPPKTALLPATVQSSIVSP